MFVWIDPPGPDAGWLHEVPDGTDPATVAAAYPIPADNAQQALEYDLACEGIWPPLSVAAYQAGRPHWGVTTLHDLPDDLPPTIVRIPTP
jgi:hypothetical protein